MANTKETNTKYALLWKKAQYSLQRYADIIREDGEIYSKSFERTLSHPKSGHKVVGDETVKENCIEQMIEVISSKEKAEQMRTRRLRSR